MQTPAVVHRMPAGGRAPPRRGVRQDPPRQACCRTQGHTWVPSAGAFVPSDPMLPGVRAGQTGSVVTLGVVIARV